MNVLFHAGGVKDVSQKPEEARAETIEKAAEEFARILIAQIENAKASGLSARKKGRTNDKKAP